MPHLFGRLWRLSFYRGMRLVRPSDVCPNLNVKMAGKLQKLFKNHALYQTGKTRMKYTYYPLCSNSAFKMRREDSRCKPVAILANGKNCPTGVKLLYCNPLWSLSLEMEVEISLSTYGKSSNFQGVFFLYVKKILKNKTGYAYYITKPQCW